MAGRVGQDVFAEHLKASLSGCGVDVSTVQGTPAHATGTAFIWVDRNGQNSIVVASGANFRFPPSEAAALRPVLQRSAWALFQLETPLDMLDPAPAQPLSRELLQAVAVLTPNETEACQLLQRPATRVTPADAPALAQALRQLGPSAVVLKLGDQGCVYRDAQHTIHVPAYPVRALDTTAAGDTFNAALAVALAEAQPLEQALRFANAAA